jgi:hypothetical protein
MHQDKPIKDLLDFGIEATLMDVTIAVATKIRSGKDHGAFDPENADDPGEEPTLPVRFGFLPESKDRAGWWDIQSGDPSFQQDWRGYWGVGFFTQDYNDADLMEAVEDLINDALEQVYQEG